MGSLKECQQEFDEWVKKHGVGNCDTVIRAHNRKRVSSERDEREKFPPRMYQMLFNRQKGMCSWCEKLLNIPATRGNEIDHIDPNRKDFNHPTNLQLLHGLPCNREKSSKDLLQQSKETGKTIQELIAPGYSREPLEDEA